MGDILAFRKRIGAEARTNEIGPAGAEILFFLGVRYERHEPVETDAKRKPAGARRRGAARTDGGGKRRA